MGVIYTRGQDFVTFWGSSDTVQGPPWEGRAIFDAFSHFFSFVYHVMTIEVPAGLRSWLFLSLLSLDTGSHLLFLFSIPWACDDSMRSTLLGTFFFVSVLPIAADHSVLIFSSSLLASILHVRFSFFLYTFSRVRD